MAAPQEDEKPEAPRGEMGWLNDVYAHEKDILERNPPGVGNAKLGSMYILALYQDSFVCQRCGQCCRDQQLTISAPQLRKIADFYGLTIKEAREIFTDGREKGRLVVRRQKNHACWFLKEPDDEHAHPWCAVYAIRPEPCREYPYFTWLNINRSVEGSVQMAMTCKHQQQHIGLLTHAIKLLKEQGPMHHYQGGREIAAPSEAPPDGPPPAPAP